MNYLYNFIGANIKKQRWSQIPLKKKKYSILRNENKDQFLKDELNNNNNYISMLRKRLLKYHHILNKYITKYPTIKTKN